MLELDGRRHRRTADRGRTVSGSPSSPALPAGSAPPPSSQLVSDGYAVTGARLLRGTHPWRPRSDSRGTWQQLARGSAIRSAGSADVRDREALDAAVSATRSTGLGTARRRRRCSRQSSCGGHPAVGDTGRAPRRPCATSMPRASGTPPPPPSPRCSPVRTPGPAASSPSPPPPASHGLFGLAGVQRRQARRRRHREGTRRRPGRHRRHRRAVSPGSTDTDMLRTTADLYDVPTDDLVEHQLIRRLIDPDEIAAAIAFCSLTRRRRPQRHRRSTPTAASADDPALCPRVPGHARPQDTAHATPVDSWSAAPRSRPCDSHRPRPSAPRGRAGHRHRCRLRAAGRPAARHQPRAPRCPFGLRAGPDADHRRRPGARPPRAARPVPRRPAHRCAVVVVDDASRDPDVVAAVARRHGARLIRLAENLGPAGARNAGLAEVTTPYVAFVDSDVEVDGRRPDGPGPPLRRPGRRPRRPEDRGPRPLGASAVVRAVRRRLLVALPRRSRARSAPERPSPGCPAPASSPAPPPLGAGFDASLRVGEDVDLVWRLVAAGHRVRYDPTSSPVTTYAPPCAAGSAASSSTAPAAPNWRNGTDAHTAPAVLSPFMAAAGAALLLRRRWSAPIALAGLAIATRTVHRSLPTTIDSHIRARVAFGLAARGIGWAVRQESALLLRHWWPLAALGLSVELRAPRCHDRAGRRRLPRHHRSHRARSLASGSARRATSRRPRLRRRTLVGSAARAPRPRCVSGSLAGRALDLAIGHSWTLRPPIGSRCGRCADCYNADGIGAVEALRCDRARDWPCAAPPFR